MQLSLDLLRTGHSIGNILPSSKLSKESNAYIQVPGCVLDYVISTTLLTDQEKLFFLLVNTLSIINHQSGNQRSVALSAESWAQRLNCAKSQVFAMQNSLEAKGYFIISRDKNKHGQNKRNLICPTLPDEIFKDLSQNAANRVGEQQLRYAPHYESKLQYLDRTKLFIMLGYQVLKDIASCEYLSPFHKIVWLDCYAACYKARVANFGVASNIEGLEFSFITTYRQLEAKFSCNKSTISITLSDLEELGLIKREHFYTRKELGDQERQDRSLWKISLPSFPITTTLSPDSEKNLWGKDRPNSFGVNASGSSSSGRSSCKKSLSYNDNNLLPSTKLIMHNVVPLVHSKPDKKHLNKVQVKDHGGCTDHYIIQVVSELSEGERTGRGFGVAEGIEVTKPGNYEQNCFEDSISEDNTIIHPIDESLDNICSHDPDIISTSLYNTKNIIINISKSNLVNELKQKVHPCDNFLKRVYSNNITSINNCPDTTKILYQNGMSDEVGRITNIDGVFRRKNSKKEIIPKPQEFNLYNLLIKEKLKSISKDKADKARMFAYSIFSQKIAKGYAATLSKNELAKQLIFHAASWRPTKVSRGAPDDKLVDMALSVAWKTIVQGAWQQPLEWAKAKALHYEFLDYKRKYRDSGVISQDLRSLESMINNLLGAKYDLASIIFKEVDELKDESGGIKKNGEVQKGSSINESKEINVRIQGGTKVINNLAPQIIPSLFANRCLNKGTAEKHDEFSNRMQEEQRIKSLESIFNIAERIDNSLEKINPRPIIVSCALDYHNELYKLNKDKITIPTISSDFYNEKGNDCLIEMESNISKQSYKIDNYDRLSFLDNVSKGPEFIDEFSCLESDIATQEDLLAKNDKYISKDFVKIDLALTEILRNLRKKIN